MRRESPWRHFAGHWLVYMAILCICVTIGATLFAITAPKDSAPHTLLINCGGSLPDYTCDGQVNYPAADSEPEVVQTYVLTTGSGGYDFFIAPVYLLQELYAQQLIQPLSAESALQLSDGTPIAIDLNGEYALCLSHSAGEEAKSLLNAPQ